MVRTRTKSMVLQKSAATLPRMAVIITCSDPAVIGRKRKALQGSEVQ